MQYFLKRKFCITQPPCESGSKYLLLLWVIWGGEWALEWAEQLCWLCCCFRCLHNLPRAIEIYRGYLWQCRNTSHFIHRFPKAQSIQSSDFLWNGFLEDWRKFPMDFLIFFVKWFGFQDFGISGSSKFIKAANPRRPNSWAAWCDGQWLGLRFVNINCVRLCQLVWCQSRAILFNGSIAFFPALLSASYPKWLLWITVYGSLIHLDPSWSILILTGWFPFCSRWTGWEWAHFDRLSWRR